MDPGLANLIIGLVAGLGIGTVLVTLVQHSLERRKSAHESQRRDLEARYRVVILLMYAAVDFERNQTNLRINRPDLKTKQAVLDELRAEWVNMTLFASSATLAALQSFVQEPSHLTMVTVAKAMRGDLGRGEVVVKEGLFESRS